jgi:triphosphatase
MTGAREVELKLEVPPTGLRELERCAPIKEVPGVTRLLTSVYFDTDKLSLRRHGFSLRIRRVEDRHVQTIKRDRNATALERNEWESETEGEIPDFKAARKTALRPLLSKKLRRRLKPVFETRVHRTTYPVKHGDNEIELSIDRGQVIVNGRSRPLHEIELEVKRGEPSQLFALAHQLARQAPLTPSVKSKAERGYELLTDVISPPAKAPAVHLAPNQGTAAAFQVIARACVRQLLANVPPLQASDPEGLHQVRVSLRRLRAAISLFGQLLQDNQMAALKGELKWLSGECGPARELNVFMERLLEPFARRHQEEEVAALRDEVKDRYEASCSRARAATDTERFRALVLDVLTWTEIGDWTRGDDDLRRTLLVRPLARTAAEQLHRRHRKILKRGKRLDTLSPQKRHKLRIATKKLRYASDFFVDVFPGARSTRRHRRFVDGLKRLQDCLGELNDIAVHEALTAELIDHGGGRAVRAHKAFAAGQLSGHEEARAVAVLRSATKAYRAFSRLKPYWN